MKNTLTVFNAQQFLDVLKDLESSTIDTPRALQVFESLLKEILNKQNAPYNIRNAGQAANIVLALLCPNDPLYAHLYRRITGGHPPPDFLESPAEPFAIQRGCAVILIELLTIPGSNCPKTAATQLLAHIESTGALPKPEDVIE